MDPLLDWDQIEITGIVADNGTGTATIAAYDSSLSYIGSVVVYFTYPVAA
jgi:hypothetical protein